ncbi:MAG TPA: hypothetical protein VGM37_14480 [Armatimonadota bacterium]|jgi:hypothetical protein
MAEIDWGAVERLVRPLHSRDPLYDWATANRMARQTAFLCGSVDDVNADRARLLCWFHALRERATDPAERRKWTRPLRDAGVSLPDQTWLWIALPRYLEQPATDEERVAHDARALERVGAVGIARAFLHGGREDRPIEEITGEIRKGIAEAVFLTPAARRLGVRRIVYARRFLKELEED